MERHASIFPVSPFSEGLTDEQLRGLIERHAVSFETAPWHAPDRQGGVGRDGWTLDVWGERSKGDAGLETMDAAHHVHDVLVALARAVLPADVPGIVFEVEPYHGKLSLDPKRGFAHEVRARVYVHHDTENRVSRYLEKETSWLDELTGRLEALGARRR